jgi:hypothetical protein
VSSCLRNEPEKQISDFIWNRSRYLVPGWRSYLCPILLKVFGSANQGGCGGCSTETVHEKAFCLKNLFWELLKVLVSEFRSTSAAIVFP